MTIPRAGWLLVVGLLALYAQPTRGARPKTWQIDEPADFLAGNLENVSLSSRAELLLAPQTQRYELDPKEADTVNTVAIGPDKRPYIGTGPNGMVYRMVDHEPQKFVEVPEGQVFSLLFLDDGSLLVGTGGRRGVIYRVGPDGQRSPFWEPSAVRYIWSMARDAAGNIYAATGTSGEIYKISPEGKNATKIVSLTTSKNVLTLAFAGQNHLVFGTDGNGLLGQVNLQTGRVRILFDAGDRSVAAIAPLPDGTIYAATTRAGTDKGAGAGPALSRPLGRPDLPDAPVASRPAGRPNGADHEPADHDDPSTTFSASIGSATLPTARGERGASSAGSAVYRIDVNGLTTEVLSLPALFLSMTPTDSSLLVGTGSPGRVYLVQPNKERYVALVRDDAAFFSAAARVPANDASQTAPAAPDDSYWIGTSRPAALVHILPDYAHEGAYTSAPQDAGQIAAWGRITADLTLPPGTNVTVQTRSSNLRDAASPGWSDWSEAMWAWLPKGIGSDQSDQPRLAASRRLLERVWTVTLVPGGRVRPHRRQHPDRPRRADPLPRP